LLKGEDVHRYDNISTDRFVVFPYILGDGKANLYAEKQLSELFPLGYSYLKECEDVLRGREKGRLMNDEFWYRYIYPKNLVLFDNEKLVAPDISLGGNFAYDEKGEFYQTTTIYGYIKKAHITESYKCLAAILNSRLCWWFLVNTGTTLANGYFRFKPDYINPFPVPKEISKTTEETIVTVVDKILEAKKADPTADTTALEREIDAMVYTLYNLTPDEITIIEK
ncbi:MAG: TaqI-like C-terminal specificity domain-containing protein, partial [Rikenellaceae bacterium]